MSFFISNAMAAAQAPSASPTESFFPLIMIAAIFLMFYFTMIRPQNKRNKEHREVINSLKIGDEILTSGGLIAKVLNVDEQFIKITLAEGVEVNLLRTAVSNVLPKGSIKSLKN